MVVPYAMFYCAISYSFVSIIVNILDLWSFIEVPKELSFFNEPYMPSLILDPICFIVLAVFQLRRRRLAICIDCKISRGLTIERGKLGEILSTESHLQLKNLLWMFGILTIIVWVYYFVWYYKNALVNDRDWYIFVWINVISIIIDEIYFGSRYYNIYLDLKDNGEIITEEELSDMTTKTYLRFYLVCGNKIFINDHVADPYQQDNFVIDTPFITKRNVNGIATGEVHSIIQRLTGIMDGELRFFYGRKSPDISKHRVLRYFYFLNEEDGACPAIQLDGKWVDFEQIKAVYNQHPKALSVTFLTDISRMVTIILTQKIFDEKGYRKINIKSYRPSFNLEEVREKNYDFQNDKWIRVSMYNSDTRGFQLRRLWGRALNGNVKNDSREWQERQ